MNQKEIFDATTLFLIQRIEDWKFEIRENTKNKLDVYLKGCKQGDFPFSLRYFAHNGNYRTHIPRTSLHDPVNKEFPAIWHGIERTIWEYDGFLLPLAMQTIIFDFDIKLIGFKERALELAKYFKITNKKELYARKGLLKYRTKPLDFEQGKEISFDYELEEGEENIPYIPFSLIHTFDGETRFFNTSTSLT